jgi:hypothetical protein
MASTCVPGVVHAASLTPSMATSLKNVPPGTIDLGPLPADRAVTVNVNLPMRNEALLNADAAAIRDPRSPLYR